MGKGREASGFGGRVITMSAHAKPIKQVTPQATVGALEPRNCIPYSTTAKLALVNFKWVALHEG